MADEVIVHTEPDEPDAATPEAVAAVVREAIHDEHVRDTLEEIKDGEQEQWQIAQMQIASLSERMTAMEITLSGLTAATAAVAAEVEAVGETVEDMTAEEDSDSEEIVLPPEPEPEPETERERGFSPLRRILG